MQDLKHFDDTPARHFAWDAPRASEGSDTCMSLEGPSETIMILTVQIFITVL